MCGFIRIFGSNHRGSAFGRTAPVLAIVAWAFCLGWITMKVLDKTMDIRVDPRIEEEGLDIYEHGETAYNS